ncbi:hypothetical protein GCM10011613_02290 [Cellvibrio zantedeschiae]|uniref:Solute-binding protein family 3/N-terminal domain-containing protein n=1 Tax=Cellvibrio zantedeschiae TaxID=1237077 RepID=A0ABQ3AS48_9GAMM|nr:hypothetical protein [Cellvibrio zantedeschiae]GGY62354.1 hypothetical protein GCM10011613_02290 [Cellvibrio zantedeschiae]
MPFVRRLGFIILLCCSLKVVAAPRPYIVDVQTSAVEGEYFADLLALILNASKAPDEVIQIRFAPEQISQARWVAGVAQGKGNNIIWTMTSKAREQTLRTIRFPLMKGLMGYRVLVIRKEDEEKFAKVKTQQDLVKLSAGQGLHWPDTNILRANQFYVLETMAKENLYKMLTAKRFDFFPRGIIEIPVEQDLIRSQNLMVEPHILLHYPTDLYFFVNKNNDELAARLEKGCAIIFKNGEFEKFFSGYERMTAAIDFLSKHKYLIIELENPLISDETLKASRQYWIEPNKKP